MLSSGDDDIASHFSVTWLVRRKSRSFREIMSSAKSFGNDISYLSAVKLGICLICRDDLPTLVVPPQILIA